MSYIKAFLNHPVTFWALLGLPSIPIVVAFLSGSMFTGEVLHVSGEFSVRFLIIAMAITPFRLMFPRQAWPRWLLARRRYLGVAAFAYGALHTVVYLLDRGSYGAIAGDLIKTGIWTGWIAFLVFVPLVLTSNDAAVRRLGRSWKTLQRGVYFAALFVVAHWIFLEYEFGGALVHFVPLALLEAYRVWKRGTLERVPNPA